MLLPLAGSFCPLAPIALAFNEPPNPNPTGSGMGLLFSMVGCFGVEFFQKAKSLKVSGRDRVYTDCFRHRPITSSLRPRMWTVFATKPFMRYKKNLIMTSSMNYTLFGVGFDQEIGEKSFLIVFGTSFTYQCRLPIIKNMIFTSSKRLFAFFVCLFPYFSMTSPLQTIFLWAYEYFKDHILFQLIFQQSFQWTYQFPMRVIRMQENVPCLQQYTAKT